MKNKDFAQSFFSFFQNNKSFLTKEDVEYLASSHDFGNYTVLKESHGSPDEEYKEDGYQRYYKEFLLDLYGKKFLVSQQWYSRQSPYNLQKFAEWLIKKAKEKNFPKDKIPSEFFEGMNLPKGEAVERDNDNENVINESQNGNSQSKVHQKIFFGAPGTGKSWTLNKCAIGIFESTSNQTNADDDSRIKESIQNAGSDNAARIAVGLKYSSVLAELAPKSIHENYSCSLDAAYGVFQGTKIKSIAKSFSDYEEKDLDAEKIKAELEKIKKDRQASWAAIGYKYSSYLSQKSTGNIQEELGLSKTSSTASWIVSGANAKDFLKDNLLEEEVKRIERVTFHPNYNYAQFVGTYKPVQDEEDDKQIVYKYVPGPFMRVYCNAKRNPNNKFLLLIEEINRANVAAVFGDVFQLLDRKNGVSEYPIAASEDIRSFLADNGINEKDLRIPKNMYIWATMNSADQGVFPMDTAFKRRWEFEYIGIDDNQEGIEKYDIPVEIKKDEAGNIIGHEWIKWNGLRHSINDKLTEMKINEDKLLGPYFISEEKLKSVDGRNEANAEEFVKSFKSKVLMYLFEDAVKMRPGDLFDENAVGRLRFSDICKKFDEIGQGIFNLKK